MKRKLMWAVMAVSAVLLVPSLARVSAAETVTIKFASLAPKGSSWDEVFQQWNGLLKKQSGGSLQLQFYNSGIAGDEHDVINKIKVGDIHAGGFTVIGLSVIVPDISLLQMGGLFPTYKQLNYVRDAMAPDFEAMFQKKGYRLLGWGDAGFGRIFAKRPILMPEDYKVTRPWIPKDDASLPIFMKIIGAVPVPRGIPEVFTGLQTGQIDTFISSAIASVALRWREYVTHVSKEADTAIVGASLINEDFFNKLNPEQKAALIDTSKKAHGLLLKKIQAADENFYKFLVTPKDKKGGGLVEFSAFGTPAQKAAWSKVNDELIKRQTGKQWSAALLEKVKKTLASAPQ